MSTRLTLVNLGLRLWVKRRLARIEDPAHMRAMMERQASHLLTPPPDAHFNRDRIARGDSTNGGRPEMMKALWASGGRPDRRRVILYLHGGAYLAGSPDTHRALGAALGIAAGARVLLPDYRLAPENPLPAAAEDAMTAYRSLLAKGIEPGALAIGGDSAGGGLTFLLLAEIQRLGLPQPAAVVAFSPWVDLTCKAPSIRKNALRDPMLPANRIDYVSALCRDGRAAADPHISPLFAPFTAPPPTMILASRDEILADDARHMAAHLAAAGGDVRLEIWPRVPHGWPVLHGWLPQAADAIEASGRFIAKHMDAAADAQNGAA